MSEYLTYNQHFKSYAPLLAEYERYGEVRPIVDNGLELLVNRLKQRNKKDYQNVVEINGGTGSGKSTVAMKLCYLMDPHWNMEENYIYTVSDLKKKLKNWKTASPISLFDEGSVILNSLDTMSRDSKDVVMLFDTMRVLHWSTFICIPDHNALNKRVRDFHIDYRLICPNRPLLDGFDKRGLVEIHTYERSDFGKGYAPLRLTTRYEDVPPRIRKLYDEIKQKHLIERMEKFAGEEEDD